MKAKEFLIKRLNLSAVQANTIYHEYIEATEEYAKDQIQKDREKVKKAYYNEETEGFFKDIIKNTPIILD